MQTYAAWPPSWSTRLGYCSSNTDDEYRAELSLPDEMEDGLIVSWKERIFIPDPGESVGGRITEPSVDQGPDIDVPVRRRA